MNRVLSAATALLACCYLTGCLTNARNDGDPGYKAEIRWTSFGVPHIRAADEHGLGYGIGYAYARDNLCLLADEVLTVRGERARFLGREGRSSAGLDNLRSDFFFRWLNDDEAVAAFLASQPPAIRQLLSGYVAGYNRYLGEISETRRPAACGDADWLRPLQEEDMARLVRRLLVEGGIGQFAEAMLAAAPPQDAAPAARVSTLSLERLQGFALERGSNAIAVGGQRTENGRGRLLANPHFPWSGGLRFYQMHLTLPGKLDVMGAALPGMPLVNIGFNRHLAWTHTVDTSSHFTLHRLTLDPEDPTRHLVDGRSLPLRKTTLAIEVREPDGHLSRQTHDVYESSFGPVLNWPGMLDWNPRHAYALQDVNLGNTRALQQWMAMNQASDLDDLRTALQDIQGVPWVNTLAVDDQGNALYMNASLVPNVPAERLAECADQALLAQGLPGLDGSRSDCDWQPDPGAAQPGVVAGRHLPLLQRGDFVQNSNDSAWMSNPAAPLVGYSPLVSRENRPLGARARYALARIGGHGERPLSEDFLIRLVTDNRVHLADLILDDLLAFCASRAADHALTAACSALASWDRRAALDSGLGLLYFQRFVAALAEPDAAWSHPFDPQHPLNTPRGLAWQKPQVARQLEQALREATHEIEQARWPERTRWGQIQFATRGDARISIPGGDGHMGIYNAIQSRPDADGRLEVVGGSSYIQLVSFDERGPVAKGLLAFSQSSDPASPHYKDQTELFSRQEWRGLPFTREQIDADPNLQLMRIEEPD
ncbi:bifunctional acylase PvdQ [Pseudomonas lopnurensis]|uniref:bifunctional acylase PvdQ n=1 Tax=Pseudomonas lopnurensis TaxID=1477517 RepID=UPI00187A87E5|nr:acylase [Pseudomonas lopnurensis]MBE7373886.1 acylase [Pseudomonas lopnurensis]